MTDSAAANNVVVVPCKYKTGRVLGQGTYATVKEAVHIETGERFAVKVLNKKLMAGREHLIRNEITVLKRVSQGHPHILALRDYFETQNNLYLVMDLASGGELFDRICEKGSYYERDAARLVRTITDAVSYLHSNDIVHRDLKPENLLFRTKEENSDLLIADFGLSRIVERERFHLLTTTCGTPGYMAPEIFRKEGYDAQVDMWAIGVITYFLLCGYTPFDRETNAEEIQAIMGAEYAFEPAEYWVGISDEAKNFVSSLLVIEPNHRLTAQAALDHPWLKRPAGVVAMDAAASDLLPQMKQNFNARRTLRKAIDMVRLLNNLSREYGVVEEHVVGSHE
ncbi:putative calmodulin-dependent protein kinase type 1 [Thamnocephalis sphaerospora]|uniref:Putative calmodulin-dependent protein kinase type 1 n=1 Tax=Thamnocephalis sphaerospora TaxID=78915 RepID=A0A4P9XV87_9FUNG|nr:putative calmodulin-dependent protein kinase type 1 [Thamnocephalis sphaerospora]|eukprot:RKP10166.1 putative calmodulin-dependent protein kinase type 1 [Thamnocephalis sphaerospora]